MDCPRPLLSRADIDAARALIEAEGLQFEERYDDLVGVFEAGEMTGCGARLGRVLKMLVVHPEHRGGAVLGEIITELMRRDCGRQSGCYFIFTKPCAIQSFERLNFRLLVQHSPSRIGLLENRNGLHQFLRRQAALARSGRNGAVVINSDPFSRGHQHLIESAAPQVERLYVFIPSDGDFAFPVDVRVMLARRGLSHLDNVTVVESGPYVLSDATFPGYFLKPGQSKDELRLEMDMALFAQHLAPFFHIDARFVGAEPLDPIARAHSRIMETCLAEHGIRLVQIARAKVGDLWINTRHIRQAISDADIERIRDFVPATTFDYLCSIVRNPTDLHPGYAAMREANHASDTH